MAVHDWTRVEAGVFHDFHVGWLPEMRTVLNNGLLPEGYYAMTEQHAGRAIADVMTLHASEVPREPRTQPLPPLPDVGGVAVADAPPQTRRKHTVLPAFLTRRRSLAIRHVSGHRLVALVEVLSPANKDRTQHIEDFADKVVSALNAGIHVLLVDLFPPGPHDPVGLPGLILRRLEECDEGYDLPPNEPLTLASYAADPPGVDVYEEHCSVGAALPDMPLFIRPDRYINVPLETTYQSAYCGLPGFWREVLEGRDPPDR